MTFRPKTGLSRAAAILLGLATATALYYAFFNSSLWLSVFETKDVDQAVWHISLTSRLFGLVALGGGIFALRSKLKDILPGRQRDIAPFIFVAGLVLEYATPGCGVIPGPAWLSDALVYGVIAVSVLAGAFYFARGLAQPATAENRHLLTTVLIVTSSVLIIGYDIYRSAWMADALVFAGLSVLVAAWHAEHKNAGSSPRKYRYLIFAALVFMGFTLMMTYGGFQSSWISDVIVFVSVAVLAAAYYVAGRAADPAAPRQRHMLAAGLIFLSIILLMAYDGYRNCQLKEQAFGSVPKPKAPAAESH